MVQVLIRLDHRVETLFHCRIRHKSSTDFAATNV